MKRLTALATLAVKRVLALVVLVLAVFGLAVADTHYFGRDGLVLQRKTYAEKVVLSDCDDAVVYNCTFKKGLDLVGCDDALVQNNRINGGGPNGGLYVGPGHPWTFAETAAKWGYDRRDGQQFNQGENLAGFIGSLGQKRDRLVSRSGNLATFDLSGLGKSHWLIDWSKNVWTVNGKWANFVRLDGDDKASMLTFPAGATVTLQLTSEAGAALDFFTYDPRYLVRGARIVGNTFSNPNGSGCSVYWSIGADIYDNVAYDCADYGIGLEFAAAALVQGNTGFRNQIVPGWPGGYNQFEMVGWAEGVSFERNHGQVGLVPKGNRQEVRIQ